MREKMIICAPVREKDDKAYPGVIRQKASCGHVVWVAPAGQKLLKKGAIPICAVCLREEAGLRIDKIRYEVTEDTVKEVSDLLGCQATRAEQLALAKNKFGGNKEV